MPMKEAFNESVNLVHGPMQMTYTVTVATEPALVQDYKFVQTCSSALANAQSLGPNSCPTISASLKTHQRPSK